MFNSYIGLKVNVRKPEELYPPSEFTVPITIGISEGIRGVKNGQATSIAPLQPSTLALFPTWGSSKGAGRRRLARHKGSKIDYLKKRILIYF